MAAAFSNTIAGVDGLQGGRDAIALARTLAAPGARITLAQVCSAPLVRPNRGGEGAAGGGTPSEKAEESRQLLERERDEAELEAELEVVHADSAGRGLHELASRTGADLLVVGSSHRGFVGRVLVGDDTRDSLNGAPCAVAAAPLGYATALNQLKRIGVGYDGSAESQAALALARELASRYGATVKLLKVVQIMSSAYAGYGGVAWGDALEEILADAEREAKEIEGVEGQAVLGVAAEELAQLGDHVDLLLVGSRGYGPVKATVLGSTSQHLAKHSRCPLVVLPRAAGDDDGVH